MHKKLLVGSAILAMALNLQADEVKDLDAKISALTEEIAKMKEGGLDATSGNQLTFGGLDNGVQYYIKKIKRGEWNPSPSKTNNSTQKRF